MAKQRLSILDALASVTPEDLTDIDQQIQDKENELATLIEARKLINVKLNGKPARQAPAQKPKAQGAPAAADGLAAKAAKVLAAKGVMSIVKLAEELGAGYSAVYSAVRKAQGFQQGEQGVSVTPEGKRLYGV